MRTRASKKAPRAAISTLTSVAMFLAVLATGLLGAIGSETWERAFVAGPTILEVKLRRAARLIGVFGEGPRARECS